MIGAAGTSRAAAHAGCCGTSLPVSMPSCARRTAPDRGSDRVDYRRDMDLGAVMHSYGGPVLFVWAWLQGEAAVIVGGALAAAGYWPWWAVSRIAAVPATCGGHAE